MPGPISNNPYPDDGFSLGLVELFTPEDNTEEVKDHVIVERAIRVVRNVAHSSFARMREQDALGR